MLTAILICGLVVSSCSNDDEPTKPSTDEVEEQLQQMTLREKVGQMFYIRAVMTAVNEGTISEERINQSVRRILTLRKELKR